MGMETKEERTRGVIAKRGEIAMPESKLEAKITREKGKGEGRIP